MLENRGNTYWLSEKISNISSKSCWKRLEKTIKERADAVWCAAGQTARTCGCPGCFARLLYKTKGCQRAARGCVIFSGWGSIFRSDTVHPAARWGICRAHHKIRCSILLRTRTLSELEATRKIFLCLHPATLWALARRRKIQPR